MGPDVALMYSGGLDSFIAYHYGLDLGLRVKPVYVSMGHEYEKKELAAADKLGVPFEVITIPWAEATRPWHVKQIIPARNLLLAMVGSMKAERVWVCGLDGEQFATNNDKSIAFYGLSSALLSHVMELWNPKGTLIESPFFFMTKAEAISWWLRSGRDGRLLLRTSSCWSKSSGKCGECGTCYKRFTAFKLNGVEEKGYDSNPMQSEYAMSQRRRLEAPDARLRESPARISEHFDIWEL